MARIIFMPKRKTLLRLSISFVVLVLSIVSLTVFLLYTSTIDEISKQLLRRVRDASVVSARLSERSGVRWDWENFEKVPEFKKLFSQYYDLVESMGLDNIYVIDYQMNCFLVVKGPPIKTAEEYVRIVKVDFDRAFRGEVILSSEYPKEGKTFISAYAPIFDVNGKVSYLVGADMDMTGGISLMHQIKKNALIILGVTVFASLLMSAILSYTIVTPIKNMVVAAEQIGLGNFRVNVPISGRDEIGFLGQTMNDMVQDIRLRDQQISKLTKGIIEDLRVYNQLILEGMMNGVITFDLDGNIESINPAASQLLDYNPDQIVGKNFRKLPALKGRLMQKLVDSVENGTFFQNFEARVHRSGVKVLISSDLAPLIDRDGVTMGQMLFISDVTEIRRLEMKIKVKEKLAAIGELSAGIAHEIRNPLNSIELFLGLLQRKLKDDESQIELVSKVRNEIKKLNQILSDFLRFARPVPLNLASEDIRQVVMNSVFFTRAETDNRNITVDIRLPDEQMDAMIDSQQIQQVFTNIILNAAQAIDRNGLLKIIGNKGEGGFWTVKFVDDGPGIPQDDLLRIFNPFFTTKDEGTGLGLAMVHKIVETHEGNIDVQSGESGTNFTVNLPEKNR